MYKYSIKLGKRELAVFEASTYYNNQFKPSAREQKRMEKKL
jgi:hypothetical protein